MQFPPKCPLGGGKRISFTSTAVILAGSGNVHPHLGQEGQEDGEESGGEA